MNRMNVLVAVGQGILILLSFRLISIVGER